MEVHDTMGSKEFTIHKRAIANFEIFFEPEWLCHISAVPCREGKVG